MDAWLPEYASRPEGRSIVLVRDGRLKELIRRGKEQELPLAELSPEMVIKSQAGVVERKRYKGMLSVGPGKFCKEIPTRRLDLTKKANFIDRRKAVVNFKNGRISGAKWVESGKDLKIFHKYLFSNGIEQNFWGKFERILLIPRRFFKKLSELLPRSKRLF